MMFIPPILNATGTLGYFISDLSRLLCMLLAMRLPMHRSHPRDTNSNASDCDTHSRRLDSMSDSQLANSLELFRSVPCSLNLKGPAFFTRAPYHGESLPLLLNLSRETRPKTYHIRP